MTGVLNESSLPTGKEQEELVYLWLVHLWMCGGCCSGPQLSPRPWASSSHPAQQMSSSAVLCPAQVDSCKHKMQVLGSALLMVLLLQGGRMWSC